MVDHISAATLVFDHYPELEDMYGTN